MFGHSNSDTSRRAIEYGLKRWTNDEARARYIQELSGLLASIGLSLPSPDIDRRVL
jgi:1,2-phenylacetyl-CoA epoxidase catalytic subunit